MKLYTPIAELSRKERRDLIDFMRAWCEHYFGSNRRHAKPLSIRCVDPGDDDDEWDNMYYGWYDQVANRIVINTHRSRHIKQFLKTFLHEYTHSLQPVKSRYNNYSKVFGYHDNPHEVHARANEIYYRHAFDMFKRIKASKK